jgi:hypothetical protein
VLPELLLHAAVPQVLDLVVRPPRQMGRDLRPPARTNQFSEMFHLSNCRPLCSIDLGTSTKLI